MKEPAVVKTEQARPVGMGEYAFEGTRKASASMAGPFAMPYAERRDYYLASAADADKKAALAKDELVRTGWVLVANGYRDLAAGLAPDVKP